MFIAILYHIKAHNAIVVQMPVTLFGSLALLLSALHCWFECVMNSVNFNIFASMKHIFSPTVSVWVLRVWLQACIEYCVHYFCTFKQHRYSILHFRILTFPAQIVGCDDGPLYSLLTFSLFYILICIVIHNMGIIPFISEF